MILVGEIKTFQILS